MGSYSEFADKVLIVLYQETDRTGQPFHRIGDLLKKYGIEYKPLWISQIADEWEHHYFGRVSRVLNGYEDWSFRISAQGIREIEDRYGDKDGVGEIIPPVNSSDDSQSENAAPAADRIVSFSHNAPEFHEIDRGIDDVREAVRQINTISEAPRDRILRALDAAKALWGAAELRAIQIKVGVLLAIEDAAASIKATAKAVAVAMLIDTLKAFVKAQTGIDLDRM